jgi:hypothetical protein
MRVFIVSFTNPIVRLSHGFVNPHITDTKAQISQLNGQADQLREAANTLITVANRIVDDFRRPIETHDGDDVWQGPAADQFRGDLQNFVGIVCAVSEELIVVAQVARARADGLTHQAVVAGNAAKQAAAVAAVPAAG